MEIWQVENVTFFALNGVGFVNVGPLGLGGNLGWSSGIRTIRSEPRRKPRMELFWVAEVKEPGDNEFRFQHLH